MPQQNWNNISSSNRNILVLLAVLLLGTAIRFRLAQDQKLHNWDEKFHALVAKNMMDAPLTPTLYKTAVLPYDYRQWYQNHIWLHKQPLPLWLMAASYKAFGVSEFATRIPSLVFSVLLMCALYLLARRLYSTGVALLSTFFLAVNGLVIELGAGRVATDHYDLLFLVFISLAIYFAERQARSQKLLLAAISGFFIGCALLTKWLPGLIVLPVHYFLLCHYTNSKREKWQALATSLLVMLCIVLPWQIYILVTFPAEARYEYLHHWLHLASELEGHKDAGWWYYLDKLRINYSEIVYLPLLYFLLKLKRNKTHWYRDLALVVWIVIPLVFFSFAKTKMQAYILFICPALFLLTADFFFQLKDLQLKKVPTSLRKPLVLLVQLLMLLLPLRYCYERTAFGTQPPQVNPETEAYKQLQNDDEKTIVLNVKWPIEFMFYTGYIAYRQDHLSAEEQALVRKSGYSVKYLKSSGTLTHLE
jgi:4-amino-4-deoxy-L-arabinose transferase-like glycosyltransferase